MDSDSEGLLSLISVSQKGFLKSNGAFYSLLKQTAYKDGWCSVILLTEDEETKNYFERINSFLPKELYRLYLEKFLISEIKEVVSGFVGDFIAFHISDTCLRPDAISMLFYFLQNNKDLDGVFPDFLLTLDDREIFENTRSYISTCFPSSIQNFPNFNKIFPSLILLKKEILTEYLTKFDNFSTFNILNFFYFLANSNYEIIKLESLLGVKKIETSSIAQESSATTLGFPQSKAFEKIFGKSLVRTITSNEHSSLPYHFDNPNNDSISIVIINRIGANKEDFQKTINSISFQNIFNFEIITNKGFLDDFQDVVFRNIALKIALGKYICFVYAGDEISPNCFVTSLKHINTKGEYYFLYFDYNLIDEKRTIKSIEYNFEKLKKFNFIPNYCFFLRRIFYECGEFDESFPIGYSLWEFFLRVGVCGLEGVYVSELVINSKYKTFYSLETENIQLDNYYKAKIVQKHNDLFSSMQIQWANSIIFNQNLFDQSKIPFGIIPNNQLLAKILLNKQVEAKRNMKRVLFVMYGWNETGGGTTFPRALAIELARRGLDVSVFFASLKYDNRMPPYSIEEFTEEGVKLFGLYNRPAPFKDSLNPEREISDPKIEDAFSRIVEIVNPDIIQFHNLHGLCLSLPEIAKKYNLPTIFFPYNYYLIDPDLYMINSDLSRWKSVDFFANSELLQKNPSMRNSYYKRIEYSKRLISEYIDVVLAVSRRQMQLLKEFSGCNEKIIVVHQINPTSDKLWKDPYFETLANRKVHSKVRFGYMGGLYPTKGVHNFVKAAQFFMPSDAEFHIYGFSSAAYQRLLFELDRKKMVTFHSEYSHDELRKIAEELDCAVLPAIYEDPAPFVLTESFAMRLPVIGSEIGGIPDFVVDGICGFLVDPDDIDSLVSAIRYCILNPDVIEQMRKNFKQYYSFEEFVNHIEYISKDLIAGKFKYPKNYELIITDRILKLPRVSDAKFTKLKVMPNDIRDIFERNGYELVDINIEDDSKDFITYKAVFKVPKPLTIETFFEETQISSEKKKESIKEEPVQKETSKPEEKALDDEFSFLKFVLEQQQPTPELRPTFRENLFEAKTEEKVFGLSDLEELLLSEEVKTETTAQRGEETFDYASQEVNSLSKSEPELNIVWEGSQFVYHSLALINREHCSNLIDTGLVEVTIVPYEVDQFLPKGNPKYEKLAKFDIRYKEDPPEKVKKLPYLWVRHQWPPKSEPPKGAKWVIMQPWEFSTLPKRFVEIFQQADELWVPSNSTRQAFLNSGLPFNKVQVIPNGIDPILFQPKGSKYPLPTNKRLKFLYVGGTTYRKGFDILLESYVSAFTTQDDVVLVVKDMGTESVYRGQTSEDLIEKIRKTPNTPEIIYFKNYFTEEEIASLYRACDVFVSPYRGEGFSLPTLEAMACGLPVIVTEGGATEDFVLDEFAWKIPSYKISIGNRIDNDELVSEAFIFEPDGDYLSNLMKSIYKDPADIVVRGVLASSYARKYWTWKRSTLKLLSRIDFLYGKDFAKRATEKLQDEIDAQILLGDAERDFSNGLLDLALEKLLNLSPRLDEFNTKYKVFYFLRLSIIYILKSDFQKAYEYLENLDEIEFNNIDKMYLVSKIEYLKGNLVEALEKYTELVSEWNRRRFESVMGNSLDTILVDMAKIMYEMGDFDKSLQLYTEVIKLNERNSTAYLMSAKCFQKVGDLEEARRMLDWALKLEPENEEAKKLMEELGVAI